MKTLLTLNTYFLRRFLVSFGATLVPVFALAYLIDIIEVSRRGRFADVSFGVAALFSALRVPAFIEQAFPFIVLFASVFALISLNRRLELVVARAAGVSVWQILAPFLIGSLGIGILVVALYNPIASMAQARAAQIETFLAGDSADDGRDRPAWLRQESEGVESIIGARAVSHAGTELAGVTVIVFDEDGGVRERIDGQRATLGDGRWVIDGPVITRVGYPPDRRQSYDLPTSLLPEYIEERIADPLAISVWELPSKIVAARNLGFNAHAFEMRFHTLIAMPALFAVMTLVAATVAMRYSRIGQSVSTIVGGIAAGFVLYVVTFLAQTLGANAVVPPVLAAWFPVVAAGLFGTTILLHQEDG